MSASEFPFTLDCDLTPETVETLQKRTNAPDLEGGDAVSSAVQWENVVSVVNHWKEESENRDIVIARRDERLKQLEQLLSDQDGELADLRLRAETQESGVATEFIRQHQTYLEAASLSPFTAPPTRTAPPLQRPPSFLQSSSQGRPITPDEATAERIRSQQAIADHVLTETAAYKHAKLILRDLTVAEAQDIIRTDTHMPFLNDAVRNPLRCRITDPTAARDDGRVRKNFKNWRRGDIYFEGSTMVYYYQIALVAVGKREEVLKSEPKAGKKGLGVSHLCLRSDCFESEHLVVETGALNQLRERCTNGYGILCGCGAKYSMCDHRHSESAQPCLRPTLKGEQGKYHQIFADPDPLLECGKRKPIKVPPGVHPFNYGNLRFKKWDKKAKEWEELDPSKLK